MKWRETLEVVEARTQVNRDLLEEIRHSQVAMGAKLDLVSRTFQEQISRLVDRIIEISMVNQGGLSDAVKHRHVARQDDKVVEEKPDPWDEDSDEWPPPGHDVMNLP